MSIEDRKMLVRRMVERVYNQGNTEMIDEVYAVDCTIHRPPYPDLQPSGLKELMSTWTRAFPDSQFTLEEVVGEGSTVVARFFFQATHTGQLGSSIPPTGRRISGPGCIVYHWAGDQIVEEWAHWDELGFWQQLGYELIPPEKRG